MTPMRVRPGCLALRCCSPGGCAAEKANGRPWIHKLDIEGVKSVKAKDSEVEARARRDELDAASHKHYLDPFERRRRQEAHRGLLRRARLLLRQGHRGRGQAGQGRQGGRRPLRRRRRAGHQDRQGHRRRARRHRTRRRRQIQQQARASSSSAATSSITASTSSRRARSTDAPQAARLRLGRGQRRGRGRSRRASWPTSSSTSRPGRWRPSARLRCAATTPSTASSSSSTPTSAQASVRSARCSKTRAAALQPRRLLVGEGGVRARSDDPELADVIITRARGHVPRAAPRRRHRLRVDALRRARRGAVHEAQLPRRAAHAPAAARARLGVLVNPASIGAPTGGPTQRPVADRGGDASRSPTFSRRWYELKWPSATTSASTTRISTTGRAPASALTRGFGTTASTSGSRTTSTSSLFFNTDPAILGRSARWRRSSTATPIPIASAGCSRTSRSTCATSRCRRTTASTSAPRSRRAASTPAAPFNYEKLAPELRLYAPLGRRVTLAGARRVRPALRAGRRRQRRSRGASSSADPIRIAASTTTACRCRCRRISRRAPICRSAAIRCCSLQGELRVDVVQAVRQLVRRWPRSSTPATWRRRRPTPASRRCWRRRRPSRAASASTGRCPSCRPASISQAAHRRRRRAALQDGHRHRPRRPRRAAQPHAPCEPDGTPNADPG